MQRICRVVQASRPVDGGERGTPAPTARLTRRCQHTTHPILRILFRLGVQHLNQWPAFLTPFFDRQRECPKPLESHHWAACTTDGHVLPGSWQPGLAPGGAAGRTHRHCVLDSGILNESNCASLSAGAKPDNQDMHRGIGVLACPPVWAPMQGPGYK